MTHSRRLLLSLALAITAQSALVAPASGAVDPAYNENDVVLFFRNPNGTTGTDSVVVFSLGSSWNVFRRAATPGDPTFGTVIALGNINTTLTGQYDTDWTTVTGSLLAGAAAQNGSLSGLSSAVSNGDYARTTYITSPRLGAGSVGQPNSAPRNVPTSNASGTASAIQGANSLLANTNFITTNPGFILNGDSPVYANNNPLTGGGNPVPNTAWTSINGGVMGYAATNSYTYGTVSNVVLGLDLYRVTPNLGNGTSSGPAWQNLHGISADYGGTGGNGWAYFLGTITLSSNGDVNFVAKSSAANPYDAWASGFGLSGNDALGSSDPDKDLFTNNQEFALGTNPTIGNAALSTTARTGNQVTVTFLRRSDVTYAVQKRSSLNTGSFSTDAGIVPTPVVPQGTVPPGYEKVSFTVTAGGNQFYRILSTLP